MKFIFLIIFVCFLLHLVSFGQESKELFDKGEDFLKKENYDEAMKYFDLALIIKPNMIEAWFGKAIIFNNLDKNQECAKCLDSIDGYCKIQQVNCEESIFYLSLKEGNLYKLNKLEESIVYLNKLIAKKERNTFDRIKKAKRLVELNKLEEAVTVYNEVIEIDNWYDTVYFSLSKIHSKLNNKTEMLFNLKNAIEINDKYKEEAKTDNDLKKYLNDKDFIDLIK